MTTPPSPLCLLYNRFTVIVAAQSTRSVRWSRMMVISILMLIYPSTGCQTGGGDDSLSQWAIAQWVMRQGLSIDGPPLDHLTPYLTAQALDELNVFKETLQPDSPLGMLTLNRAQGHRWVGRYAYLKGPWPLALNFEMTRSAGFWQIDRLPFAAIYGQLAKVLRPGGLPEIGQGEVKRGGSIEEWEGGLISFDRSGRPQGEVVVTWIPPYAFVDGVPLNGKATSEKLISAIETSFKLRSQMASVVQASYTPRVALCLETTAPASDVQSLLAWSEASGAQVISLLARHRQIGPILIRLARRVPEVILLSPQRMLSARLETQYVTIHPPHGGGVNAPPPLRWSLPPIIASAEEKRSLIDRQVGQFAHFYQRSKKRGKVAGLILSPNVKTTYADLIFMIESVRQIDQSLPIALAPLKSSTQTLKGQQKGGR